MNYEDKVAFLVMNSRLKVCSSQNYLKQMDVLGMNDSHKVVLILMNILPLGRNEISA